MRRIPTIATALAAVLLIAAAAFAAPLTPQQLLDLKHVTAVDIAPDGKLVVYRVTQNRAPADESGGAWSELWVVPAAGGEPRPFVTGEVQAGSPAFSPDGRHIGFTLKRGEDAKTQVWAIPVDGGEARPATASPVGVSAWAWSADGDAVLYVDTDQPPARERSLKKKGWLPEYFEENLRDRSLRRAPFAFGAAPDTGEVLVGGRAVWGLHAAAKGRFVAFGASEINLVDQSYMFQDIHVLDLETGESRLVIDVPGKLGDYRLSPDGGRLAWTAAASRSDHAVSSLFVADTAEGRPRNLTPDRFPGHIRHVEWRDDRTLLVLADEGVHTNLYRVDATKDAPGFERLLDGGELGLVFGMPAARPGARAMALIGQGPTMPREAYAWTGKGGPRRLTRHNAVLDDVDLGEQKVVTWTARDGLEIEGILMLPVGWDGEPAPLVVDVHGGPESNERHGWLSRYASPGQVLCGKGFAVLFPNYRGSTGYGLEFAAMAYGDPAGPEFDDIVDGVEHLVAEGVADAGKVGVMGGSYGGYATNWLATKYTDVFAAGVSFVGVSNLVSKRLLTNIPYEDEYVHMGAPVRGMFALMHERSPVYHAHESRTPLLILHGDSDPRVHPSQSQELYRALKMAGHPAVRLIYYPGEGHGNARRFGRDDALQRTVNWFVWYLQEDHPADGPMPALDISDQYGLEVDD